MEPESDARIAISVPVTAAASSASTASSSDAFRSSTAVISAPGTTPHDPAVGAATTHRAQAFVSIAAIARATAFPRVAPPTVRPSSTARIILAPQSPGTSPATMSFFPRIPFSTDSFIVFQIRTTRSRTSASVRPLRRRSYSVAICGREQPRSEISRNMSSNDAKSGVASRKR